MAMVVQHNLFSMFSERQLGITSSNKAKSQEKLASGYKINRAADNAAGLAISEKMRKQIRGIKRGLQNTTDGISFVQIADGAMAEVHDMLHRMEELSVQAANGTNLESDRKAIDAEVQQLKKEINRISETTKFNETKIFDQEIEAPSFQLHGRYFAMEDINIYNSTYDKETGKVTYGGMILYGDRISWDSIDPNMVNIDEETGKQTFNGGEYEFTYKGGKYKIMCNDGADVPQISREYKFTGDMRYLYLGQNRYDWSDFVDDNGYALSMYDLHPGKYTRKGSNDTIELDFTQYAINMADLADIKAAADDGLIQWPEVMVKEAWSHAVETAAMEMVTQTPDGKLLSHSSMKSENITTTTQAHNIIFGDNNGAAGEMEKYRLRAGKEDEGDPVKTDNYTKNGVWLEQWKTVDAYDADGNRIPVYTGNFDGDGNPIQKVDGYGNPVWKKVDRWVMVDGSLKTWEDIGLQDESGDIWKSGNEIRTDVNDKTVFSYSDVRADGTTIGYSFVIDADVTSLDSVIDGIDKAAVYNRGVKTSYKGMIDVQDDDHDNITGFSYKISAKSGELLSAAEEYAWGRDYTLQNDKGVGTDDAGEISGSTAVFVITNSHNTQSMRFAGNTNVKTDELAKDTKEWVDYVEKQKKEAILCGIDPDNVLDTGIYSSLKDVVGAGNYTDADNLIEEVDLAEFPYANRSNGSPGFTLPPTGVVAGAHIDFKEIGSSRSIMDLAGMGFDSTCVTCYNHYSVLFTSGEGSDYDKTIPSTVAGKDLRYKIEQSAQHYLLRVDLDSFMEAGITDGASFASNLLKVLSGPSGSSVSRNDQLDFHYTQFAVKDSTLYILDDRDGESYRNIPKDNPEYGTFAMKPYEAFVPKTSGKYDFALSTSDNKRSMNLNYEWDFTDIKDNIKVNMERIDTANNETAVRSDEDIYYIDPDNDKNPETNEPIYTKLNKQDYLREKYRYRSEDDEPWVEPTLYRIGVTYKKQDGTNAASKEVMQRDYATAAVKEMIEKTSVSLDATDYTKVTWNSTENPNVAMDSRFETSMNVHGHGRNHGLKIQHSGETRDWTFIPQFSLNTFALGIYRASCKTEAQATMTIDLVNKALKAVSYRRSVYGAIQNRLEHTYNNRNNTMENTTAAESRIRDTDIAKEMSNYAKHNILEQAGQSMLAQANQSTNGTISLLQG